MAELAYELQKLSQDMDQLLLKEPDSEDGRLDAIATISPLKNQIIAKWCEELKTKKPQKESLSLSWWKRFCYNVKKVWDYYYLECSSFASVNRALSIVWLVILIVRSVFGFGFFYIDHEPWRKAFFWNYWFYIIPILWLSLILLLVPAVRSIIHCVKEKIIIAIKYRTTVSQQNQGFNDKIAKLDSDPAFLVLSVQDHLNDLADAYLKRLLACEALIKASFAEPRLKAEQAIVRLMSDCTRFLSLKRKSFNQEKILKAIDERIAEYQLIIEQKIPEEEVSVNKYNKTKEEFGRLKTYVNGLSDLHQDYESEAEILSSLESHGINIVKIKSDQIDAQISVNFYLDELSGYITRTQGMLTELRLSLPGSEQNESMMPAPKALTAQV